MTIVENRGLVAPEASSSIATNPLPVGSVRLTGGLWAKRQAVNREASLAHGGRELAKAGNFQNFRNLLGKTSPHGHSDAADSDVKNFVDSDVYKWLEAVGWESVRGPLSSEVEAQAEEAIELIVAAQDDDGYLNTWYQTLDRSRRFTNMQFGHELYCLGHLIQAAIAYSRARGDRRLLTVARRFADLVVCTFGESGRQEVCGHPEIEMSLVELSRETGDERYLALAKAFIDRRGHGTLGEGRFGSAYYQDRRPFREMNNVEGHAVRAVYLGAGATDVATDTKDEGLLAASAMQWSNMVASKMYLTGGIGSRHWGESFGDEFELPADRAYCETCGAIGVAMWSWRLLLTDVQGRYSDIIERSLLNGFLGGVSEDGTAFNYVNPLQVRMEHPRKNWFEIACCPPNAMRALASVEQYVATADDVTVFIHQFADCEIDVGSGRSLSVSTDFPWNGSVHLEIESTDEREWTLSVRVPSWSTGVALRVNGEAMDAAPGENGYLPISRVWATGDAVDVEFGMQARFVTAPSQADALRGAIAIERGPLVYCIEEQGLPAGGRLDNVRVSSGVGLVERVSDDELVPVLVAVAAHVQQPGEADWWPYISAGTRRENTPSSVIELTAIPYFAWGNRATTGMRVWLSEAAF